MKVHLSWDKNSGNGIIYNDKYDGVLCRGNEFAPKMSFEYDYFFFSEVHPIDNYVINGNIKRDMLTNEEDECRVKATNWLQPEGQEGNLSQDQLNKLVKGRAMATINSTNAMVTHLSDVLTNDEEQAILDYRIWLQTQIVDPIYPMEYNITAELQSAGAKFGLSFTNDINTKGIWVAP